MNNTYVDIIETLWIAEHLNLYQDDSKLESSLRSIIELTPFIFIGLNPEIIEASDQVEERLHLINDLQNAINIIDDSKAGWGVFD